MGRLRGTDTQRAETQRYRNSRVETQRYRNSMGRLRYREFVETLRDIETWGGDTEL